MGLDMKIVVCTVWLVLVTWDMVKDGSKPLTVSQAFRMTMLVVSTMITIYLISNSE